MRPTRGFIVDSRNETAALDAIRRINALDRTVIGREFERRFTSRRMAEDYLRLYRRLIAKFKERDRPSSAAVAAWGSGAV
jgi:hypothetical protein